MEFQQWFPDDDACAEYLFESRWPEGFWLQGTHRGVSSAHLQVYLDEYAFRFNRRRTPMAAFQTLLGLQSQQPPTTYRQIVATPEPVPAHLI